MTDKETLWGKTPSGESWHIVDTPGDPDKKESPVSQCGHMLGWDLEVTFKGNEKTCESCLRIDASND